MFLVPFFDLQNFILLVRTVPFLRKIIFISSYTAKNNYFLLYELIQDLPYVRLSEHTKISFHSISLKTWFDWIFRQVYNDKIYRSVGFSKKNNKKKSLGDKNLE